MQTQDLYQAILDIIESTYKCKYKGLLEVEETKEGTVVKMGWRNTDQPDIVTAADLKGKEFLKFFQKDIRERHLDHVKYFTGYKIYPGQMSCEPIDTSCKPCQRKQI